MAIRTQQRLSGWTATPRAVAAITTSNFPKGQECQLELYFGYFTLHVLIREAKVDTCCVDVPMPGLFLQGIQATAAVEEVDSVPVPEQMGVNISLETCLACSLLDDLVCSLLCDSAALS